MQPRAGAERFRRGLQILVSADRGADSAGRALWNPINDYNLSQLQNRA
jgi:hypothetical protein